VEPGSSGFRRIELRGDRLESVGHVAPIVAPGGSGEEPVDASLNELRALGSHQTIGSGGTLNRIVEVVLSAELTELVADVLA